MVGMTKRERRPITPDLLRKIKGVWDLQAHKAGVVMLWAVCCLCVGDKVWCRIPGRWFTARAWGTGSELGSYISSLDLIWYPIC